MRSIYKIQNLLHQRNEDMIIISQPLQPLTLSNLASSHSMEKKTEKKGLATKPLKPLEENQFLNTWERIVQYFHENISLDLSYVVPHWLSFKLYNYL